LLEDLLKRGWRDGSFKVFFFKLVGLTGVVNFMGNEKRFFLAWVYSSEDEGCRFGALCERALAWANLVVAMKLDLPVAILLSIIASTA
jgi:hypothetical protein